MISQRRRNPISLAGVPAVSLCLFIGLSGCKTPGKAANKASDQRAKELGLSSEALDPSLRDKRDGYGRWKQKPDPAGTESPLSRDRRSWADYP